jgi:hypothetical protein
MDSEHLPQSSMREDVREVTSAPPGQPLIKVPLASPVAPNDAVVSSQTAPPIAEPIYGFANDVHGYLWANIVHAEQKAGFLFALATGLLAYLHGAGLAHRWLINPRFWRASEFLIFLSVSCLLIATFCLMAAVVPRTGGSRSGLVFWKAIAACPSNDYVLRVTGLTKDQLGIELLKHTHELAFVCKGKFWFINAALWFEAAGVVSTIIFFAIGK